MCGQFLFVPCGFPNKRQKELTYAECKSHLAKVAHGRRRKTSQTLQALAEVPVNEGVTRSSCRRHRNAQHNEMIARASRTSKPDELRKDIYPLPPSPRPKSLVPYGVPINFLRNDDLLSNPAIATSPQVMYTIHFAQFHLTKSCSPPFMQRIIATTATARAEQATELRTTRWLWNLWASNTGLFWAILASVVPLMTRLASTPESKSLEQLAMRLKARSLKDLQNLLHQIAVSPNDRLLTAVYHVKALFREACASGDTSAAVCHARMVEELAGLLRQRESTNLAYSQLALWSDALPALLQMRRPIVQYSLWMTPVIKALWKDAEDVLSLDKEIDSPHVHRCVNNRTVREAFLHLRRALRLINGGCRSTTSGGNINHSTDADMELTFRWLTTKAEHHICRLLHFYLNAVDTQPTHTTNNTPGASSSTLIMHNTRKYVELSFALALLYLYQKTFFAMQSPDGTDVHESAYTLYPLFRRAVQQAQLACSSSNGPAIKQDALLWMGVVGVEMEINIDQTVRSSCGKPPSALPSDLHRGTGSEKSHTWFHSQLPIYTTDCGLQSWNDVCNVLRDFVWDDVGRGNVEEWFRCLTMPCVDS